MAFTFGVPKTDGTVLELSLNEGDILFVLGANGTGKSAIMHRFFATYSANARRLSAHRQTWFGSKSLEVSAAQRSNYETNIQNADTWASARWHDQYPSQRVDLSVFRLIEAENSRARSITSSMDAGDVDRAKDLSQKEAPIATINRLLRLSNLPISLSVQENDQILASKSGGAPYSISELSDGERNALLLAAEVLTAKKSTLLLIDEPERHLHRSIISPLLTLLFATRPDCTFIVSTHEVMLPLDNSRARTLLVRDCTFSGESVAAWNLDLVPSGTEIDDGLKRDILGARTKLLFVEGREQSLDKSLYSLVFPTVSIIAKSSWRDVEHAVSSIRDSKDLHWLHAFGLIDNDRRTVAEIAELKKKGIYAISCFSVESIYYHPEIQRRIAERHASVTGKDAATLVANAKVAALEAIAPHTQRLSERAVEKAIRDEILRRLPGRKEIAASKTITISIDAAAVVTAEHKRITEALNDSDLSKIIAHYPVRETAALTEIASKLGFQNREQYEGAVLKLLIDDAKALAFVKSLLVPLEGDINIA